MWSYCLWCRVILLIGVIEALFSCEHVLESVFYEEVMHYDDLTAEKLNQWSLPGIWAGCLFSLGWLKICAGTPTDLMAVALLALALYAGGFYFTVDSSISITQLRLPLVCRGFAYAVLSIFSHVVSGMHNVVPAFLPGSLPLQRASHAHRRTCGVGPARPRLEVLHRRRFRTLFRLCGCGACVGSWSGM